MFVLVMFNNSGDHSLSRDFFTRRTSRALPAVLALACVLVLANVAGAQNGITNGPPPPDQADCVGAASDPQEARAPQRGEGDAPEVPKNPFVHQVPIPDFPRDLEWLNSGGPLRKTDLRGKFVILDFWTYCCINCIHILPELKKLEQAYPNQLVVIGVHSAKFETEKGSKNIEEAILRYEIEHPVINDANHRVWNMFGARSWPTILLVDPEGNAVWGTSGEIQFEDVDALLKAALPFYRSKGVLDESPIRFDLLEHRQDKTALRFPGKVLADEANRRLFIADSNHNRIVVASFDGELSQTIGSGTIGFEDGDFASATFDHPQGMALLGESLFVADTENHALRKVDMNSRIVETIAGTGKQGRGWPGMEGLSRLDPPPERWVGPPKKTALNSPWALWVHRDDLFIAMAGPHQIWKMPLDESEIGPYAGNGREDIVDGPLLPKIPYREGFASFAQPSGLTSDGKWLYVADSEGSSIRAVPFDPRQSVKTVVGSVDLPHSRLFTFGDRDGDRREVLLQHALGVAYADGKIYTADTYNNKIKVVDAASGHAVTLAGTGDPGHRDEPAEFDEPAGIAHSDGTLFVADTNNHRIRKVDVRSGRVTTMEIRGLTAPEERTRARKPDFTESPTVKVESVSLKPLDGNVHLRVALAFPLGWKINKLAPMKYWIEAKGAEGPVARGELVERTLGEPASEFVIPLPVSGVGPDHVDVSLVYYYCQAGGEGLCKVGSVVWQVPLRVDVERGLSHADLKYEVEAD